MGGVKKLIVPKSSANMGLPHERITHLDADHRGVCNFETPGDPAYVTVRNASTETIDRISEKSNASERERQRAQRRWLRDFLNISRELNGIETKFEESLAEGSCEWLSDLIQFQKWRHMEGSKIFWLTGNPATRKSFLARHVHEHLEALGCTRSYFFFRDGKSTLLQCLLYLAYQMACESSAIREKFRKVHEITSRSMHLVINPSGKDCSSVASFKLMFTGTTLG